MRLGVYGGSFDPPHNGHLALCLLARELLQLDRIIISVSNNPFKHGRGAHDSDRKHMAELLSAEINLTGVSSEVCGWELEKRTPSYTVDLLKYIHTLYPSQHITLLLGEDSYRELPLWKEPGTVMDLCEIAVFGRENRSAANVANISPYAGSVRFIAFDLPVSSTEIRELVARGEPVEGLVPSSIRHYIAEHSLYRS
ncbi:MAG: nicotinate (nicotinamide) nucleotide adenylyltransferase [Chlorobiaceae bacterium]|nr:nicotinate (nicotinamide) nucleotide adenylyltransferase [Chlorobiaceae bacterium]